MDGWSQWFISFWDVCRGCRVEISRNCHCGAMGRWWSWKDVGDHPSKRNVLDPFGGWQNTCFFFDVLYMFREGCWVKAYTHPLIIYYNAYKDWFVALTKKCCLACLAPTFYTGWAKKAKCKDGKIGVVLISRFSMLGFSCWTRWRHTSCNIFAWKSRVGQISLRFFSPRCRYVICIVWCPFFGWETKITPLKGQHSWNAIFATKLLLN